MLKGFELLAKVESIDKDFISGPPWQEKLQVVLQCGYLREDSSGNKLPQLSEFHEAYEDARIFRDMFTKELNESYQDPQALFLAFSHVREETLFPEELIEDLKTFGIEYIFEMQEAILEHESAY